MSEKTELLAIAAVNALRPLVGVVRANTTPLNIAHANATWRFLAAADAILARYDAALLQEYPDGIPVKTQDDLENLR